MLKIITIIKILQTLHKCMSICNCSMTIAKKHQIQKQRNLYFNIIKIDLNKIFIIHLIQVFSVK